MSVPVIGTEKQKPARVDDLDPDIAATIATVCSLLATALAGIFLLTRVGFDSHLGAVLRALGLSYFLLFFPSACRRLVIGRFGTETPWWTTSRAVFTLSGIAGLAALGVAVPVFDPGLYILMPACGFLFAAWYWFRFALVSSARTWCLLVVGVVIFALWSSSTYYGGRDPLFLERLIVTGETTIDAVFHASILNMIKTYGAVSTGLDGLVLTPYHFGSHWLFAQLSTLLRIDALSFYLIAFQVVFVPLFLYSAMLFGLTVRKLLGRPITTGSIRHGFWLWLVLGTSTIGFAYLDSISITRNETIAQSESFCVSMILTLLTGSVTLTVYQRLAVRESKPDPSDRVFLWGVFPILMGAIGMSKISTLAVLVVALGYLFFRLRLFKRPLYVVSLVATAVVSLAVALVFADDTQRLVVVPFDYLIHFVLPDAYPGKSTRFLLFVVFRFFWVWMLLAVVCLRGGLGSIQRIKDAIRQRSTVGVEVAIVLASVGVVPGLIWAFPAGAAGYFLAVQNWIALGLLLGYIFDAKTKPADLAAPAATRHRGGLKAFGLALGVAVLLPVLALQTLLPLRVFLTQHLAIRTSILMMREGAEAVVRTFDADSRESLAGGRYRELAFLVVGRYVLLDGDRYLRLAPAFEIGTLLERLRDLPLADKRRTALFIPRRNNLYWGGLKRNHLGNNVSAAERGSPIYGGGGPRLNCNATPFMVPAVAGLAMLDGLPEASCKANYYGYANYYERRTGQLPGPLGIEDIKQRAWREGFSKLVVIDLENDLLVTREYTRGNGRPPVVLFVPPKTAWFDPAWAYRQELVLVAPKVMAAVSDVPLLVEMEPGDVGFWQHAQPSGRDVRFVDAEGRPLAFDIEMFDSRTQRMTAWVRVPELRPDKSAHVFLYYGNPQAAPAATSTAVWPAEYVAVWHMNDEGTGGAVSVRDSSTYGRHGGVDSGGAGPEAVPGRIAGGMRFTGSIARITVPDAAAWGFGRDDWSIEFWINPEVQQRRVFTILEHGSKGWFHLYLHPDDFLVFERGDGHSINDTSLYKTTALTPGVWTHVLLLRTGDLITPVVNGEFRPAVACPIAGFVDSATLAPLTLGSGSRGALAGVLDEVRIARGRHLAADWIRANYYSQNGMLIRSRGQEEQR